MDQILDFFSKLLDVRDWPPRWHCGKWTEFHGWLYIISDLLIWTAYFAIPLVIIRYVSRKKNIQFTRLYFLFAAFILACGATHFLDAVAFWIPVYRLSALVRFITGIVSWVTVFYLVKQLPVIFSLRSQSALEAEITERKRTEQALKKSRKDYELLIGGVKDYAIFMLDTEGKVASWNSGAEHIKGYKWAEIIGKPISVFYTPEQLQQDEPQKNLQQALLHGKFETEGWRVRKDGTLFWADVIFTALYDEENRFYGYAKVTKDISEKRKAEERILFLASIASNIQDPYISTDNKGMITRWNKAAELLLGWKAEDVVGKAGTEILKIDYLQTTRELVIESFNEKKYWQGEVVYHTRTGRPVHVLVTVSQLLDADGNIAGNLALVKDITERKKVEEVLSKLNLELEQKVKERTEAYRQSEAQYRHLFQNNPMPMWVLSLDDFRFLDVNEMAMLQYGYSRQEFLSMSALEIRPEEDRDAFSRSDHILTSGNPHYNKGIWRHRKKDGTVILVEIIGHEILFEGMHARLILAKDVTEQKQAEQKIISLNEVLEEKVAMRTEELKRSNEELEAFSYSGSHCYFFFQYFIQGNYFLFSLFLFGNIFCQYKTG
ncbi:MAG: PAS domain-containing protein, partial [Ferruginibacter sp.]